MIETRGIESLVHPFEVPKPEVTCIAEGCAACRETGFKGRAGIYELLTITDQVKPLINDQMEYRMPSLLTKRITKKSTVAEISVKKKTFFK